MMRPIFWIDPQDMNIFDNSIFQSESIYVTKSNPHVEVGGAGSAGGDVSLETWK